MPAFEVEKARKFVREYLNTLDDVGNVVIKDVRKYLEKKFNLPRKSLNENKNEIKTLIKEEATKIIESRTAEKEKTETKEKPKKAAAKKTEKTEKAKKAEADDTESDPEPKRFVTSYMLFAKENREKLAKEHPEMKLTEVSKILGSMWKELPEAEKEKYHNQSEEDKKKYEAEMAAWKERHPDAMTRREKNDLRRRERQGKSMVEKSKSAFHLFCADHPELDAVEDKKERTKKRREMWKELDEEKRAEYVEKAKEAKEKYNEEKRAEEEEKEKKKEKAEKKALRKKIPRAKTSFVLYCEDNRERVRKENPEAKAKEVMVLLGAAWKKEDAETVKKYQDLYEEEKKKAEEAKKKMIESGELVEKKKKEKRLSGYNMFVTSFYTEYAKSHPDASFKDRSIAAATAWKEMSDKKKEKYQKMAEEHNKNLPPDAEKPGRVIPSTAEGVFTKEFRDNVLSEKPDTDAHMLKMAARRAWRKLSVEKKIDYEDKAHELNVARLRQLL